MAYLLQSAVKVPLYDNVVTLSTLTDVVHGYHAVVVQL